MAHESESPRLPLDITKTVDEAGILERFRDPPKMQRSSEVEAKEGLADAISVSGDLYVSAPGRSEDAEPEEQALAAALHIRHMRLQEQARAEREQPAT